jgi:hypothetical protein
MPIFIPPALAAVPAPLARFVQLGTRMIRLPALPPMMFDGFMKAMIGPCDTPLAIVIIGTQTRRAGKKQESRQRGTRER